MLSSLLSFVVVVVPWSIAGSAAVFLFGHFGAAAVEPPNDNDEEQQPEFLSLGVVVLLVVILLAVLFSPVRLILLLRLANK
jgi:xanthine/uracil permease